MDKRKRTNNDLQNTTQEIKDWALQTGENSGAPEKLAVHVPPVTPIMLNDKNIVWYGNRIGCQDTLINTNNSSQDKWGVKTFIHLWPSTRHLNILTNQATTLGMYCFYTLWFSRLIADWSIENMNSDVTSYRLSLDVSVAPK